jgi:hypothetical protein
MLAHGKFEARPQQSRQTAEDMISLRSEQSEAPRNSDGVKPRVSSFRQLIRTHLNES